MEVRKDLTDEWHRSGVEDTKDFATLTDIMTKEWSGKTTREYKTFKGLKRENLRDHMTNMELVLNMLAEVSATDLSKETDPIGIIETSKVAKQGGSVAKAAREQYEKQSGKNVVTSLNAKDLKSLKGKEDGDKN
jgi:outer membrane receptor for ferric coprogen and ferric-rhodotorulic acid